MRCRASLAATAAALLLSAAPAHAVETGVNETIGQTVSTADKASALGADWVRLWASWETMEPAPGRYDRNVIGALQAHAAALRARGVKVLVVVQRSPGWAGGGIQPPADPAAFGRFMGHLAAAAPAVDAWEVWNEPDSLAFFAGAPDPAKYAAMLRSAYGPIKAAQPGDVVVTGGTVGNNMDFIRALYANGAQGSFDAVGVHTDTACLVDGPDHYYRDELGRIGRYVFSGYREVHAVMAEHGDGAKPIWMTELGWNTQSTKRGSCNVGMWAGKKRLGVSKKRQARFLRAAYRCVAADPIVGVAFWFGLQDIPRVHTRHARGFGLYRRNGKAKPAAKAFRKLDRGIRPRRGCGGHPDRVAPTIRVLSPRDGSSFSDKLTVRVRGFDNRGGSGIGRIKLALDGQHIRSWGGSGGSISPWWGSADWKRGPHTLTFTVSDYAKNETTVSVTVTKR